MWRDCETAVPVLEPTKTSRVTTNRGSTPSRGSEAGRQDHGARSGRLPCGECRSDRSDDRVKGVFAVFGAETWGLGQVNTNWVRNYSRPRDMSRAGSSDHSWARPNIFDPRRAW